METTDANSRIGIVQKQAPGKPGSDQRAKVLKEVSLQLPHP